MCELLGLSANTPTDICFSLAGLIERGGRTGPHKDGWGIAFYEGKGVREFRDHLPCCESEVAELVSHYPIKSQVIISHIRQANAGRVCLENTHPFVRELWGRNWVFAHNGQLKGFKKKSLSTYLPVGTTDSEYAFCWLLGQLKKRFDTPPKRPKTLWRFIHKLFNEVAQYGVCNLMLSDNHYLYCYCTTNLHWITRKAPFSHATLSDKELTVNFNDKTTPEDVVAVISTTPLTCNETWNKMQLGHLYVMKDGVLSAVL